ncbi:MAG: class I SAM-dependent methyltransferase [Patescibacteria group bacterium]
MGLNSSQEYDRIYEERQKRGQDAHDMRRWGKLLRYFSHGDIIDLGCLDSGIVDLVKNRKDTTYTGIDIAELAIHTQKIKYKNYENVSFFPADLYETPFQDEAFDYVVLGEVIEHLDEPQKAITEAMRILRKDGTLALSTPLEEEKEIGAIDKDRHVWSFSKQDIIDLLSPYNEPKIQIIGSQYFPTYKYAWPTLIAFCKKNGI